MGIIERRNGLLHYVGTAPITTALIKKVLASNAKKREEERGEYHDGLASDPRTEKFYELLPDMFTTKTASEVAEKVGIPKTTMQRIFRKDKRFYRIRHGTYCKDTLVHDYEWSAKPFYGDRVEMTFTKPVTTSNAPTQQRRPVGIIRRFINWLW